MAQKSTLPWPALIGIGLLALLLGLWLGTPTPPKTMDPRALNQLQSQLEAGTLLPHPRPLIDATLERGDGQAFTRNDLKDQWSVLFFGYTRCPDVCPMELSMLGQTLRILEKQGAAQPTGIFVSVDPQRDSAANAQEFAEFFHPDFIGVTGQEEAISQWTRSLGILFERDYYLGKDDPDIYLINHSAGLIVIGPSGEQVALFSPPHNAEKVAADLRVLMQRYPH
jgi:protein SCO1/2